MRLIPCRVTGAEETRIRMETEMEMEIGWARQWEWEKGKDISD